MSRPLAYAATAILLLALPVGVVGEATACWNWWCDVACAEEGGDMDRDGVCDDDDPDKDGDGWENECDPEPGNPRKLGGDFDNDGECDKLDDDDDNDGVPDTCDPDPRSSSDVSKHLDWARTRLGCEVTIRLEL